MAITDFHAKVREHELLGGKFQYIDFELVSPPRIQFTAGQYLLMRIPGLDQLKSYSIASSPDQDHSVEVLVDISPGGEGSLYLASLAPGDEVSFKAPVGVFTVADPAGDIGREEKKLLFIATGSGISSIRSHVLDLLQTKKDKREIYLHWGFRYAEELFWEEDFRQLAEYFPNFHFDLVLSRPPKDWPLCSGYVTDCVVTHHRDFSQVGAYLCGNAQMILDMKKILEEKGVPRQRIHTEQYY